ncbi:hypothetical protein [Alistipes indistinctus]|uniref:hypothetical protein n=1 Tax=Alistipes indistinctus TaxID=626932 RepID=UPI0026DD2504|nr:hypothetical protein [Alistipes indistinctus]
MKTNKLLRRMVPIAHALMTGFQTDFTVHDAEFVCKTQAKQPFIWLVRELGTRLFPIQEPDNLRFALENIEIYARSYKNDFVLYYYDGHCLRPIVPATVRRMIQQDKERARTDSPEQP